MPRKAELVVLGGQVITPKGSTAVCGGDMKELTVFEQGWVACADGQIIGIGEMGEAGG